MRRPRTRRSLFKEHLVLQHHVAHQASGVCLDKRLQTGDTGEHKDTIDPEHPEHLEREVRETYCLANEINVADLLAKLLDIRGLGGDIGCSDRGDEVYPWIRGQLT